MFHGDAYGYYSYLPSTFIYHNLKHPEVLPDDTTIYYKARLSAWNIKENGFRTPKGYVINQYTYAVALMELPFFLAAHLYEKATSGHANGYTLTYDIAIRISSAVYALLGLLLMYRVLRRYYDPLISIITTSLVLLATNLFWFSVHQAGMSHPILFFLYALVVYLTIRLHEQPNIKRFALLGFVLGFVVIMRPTDVVSAFIPLLYGVYNRDTFKERIRFITRNTKGVTAGIICGVLPFIPQMIYWKVLTGKYLYYSYGKQSFTWKHPKIIEGLFYFSNGWLPYTPIMFIAIAGLLLYKSYHKWLVAILVISPVYMYLIYSWYCYNYINGLGSRPMIHLYALYALPLAAVVQSVFNRGVVMKTVFLFVACFFVAANYSFSELRYKNLLNTDEAKGSYAMHVLFKHAIDYDDLVLNDIGIKQPESNKLTKVATILEDNFDDSSSANYLPNSHLNLQSKYCYRMKDNEYPPNVLKIPYDKKLFGNAKWFKCSGKFMVNVWESYRRHILCVSTSRDGKSYMWTGVNIDNKIGLVNNECGHADKGLTLDHFEYQRWGEVYFYTPIPEDIKEGDIVELLVWNLYKKEIQVDDLKLELYK